MARARSARRSAPSSADFTARKPASISRPSIFGAQALVILLSPAVSLARQPDMVGEPAKGLQAC